MYENKNIVNKAFKKKLLIVVSEKIKDFRIVIGKCHRFSE